MTTPDTESDAASGPVELSITNDIATLTLRRADHLNAFDIETAAAFRAAVREVRSADPAALVMTGTGRAFCAGGDVRAMAASPHPPEYLRALTDDMHPAILDLVSLPFPVIGRVNGAAAGAGIGLLLACDTVVASESATFTAAYGKLGVTPDCGVGALLPGAVGPSRAADFLVRARQIDAATALAWGLVHEVVPSDALDERTAAATADATHAGRASAARLKRSLAPDPEWLARRLDEEADDIVALADTDLTRSRLRAFTGSR